MPSQLKILRTLQDLTQVDLSSRSAVRRASISEIERGLREPRITTAVRIANALGYDDPAQVFPELFSADREVAA